MSNIHLHFSQLYTYDELVAKKEANSPGIYIWGFRREDGSFVPYYVGESKNSIKNRIIDHFLHLNYSNTYMIFNNEFLSKFENQNSLLKRVGNVDQTIVAADSLFGILAYANKEEYMRENGEFKNFIKGMSSQYVDLKRTEKSEKIQSIIEKHFSKENLFYSFAPFKFANGTKTPKEIYKYLEMVAKFSLRNNVVSQSSNFSLKLDPIVEFSSENDILRPHFYSGSSTVDIEKSTYSLYK